MSKKARRSKAKRRARATASVPRKEEQVAVAAPKGAPRTPRVKEAAKEDFALRHAYVIPELKRIAIITGAMIFALIILSFILH